MRTGQRQRGSVRSPTVRKGQAQQAQVRSRDNLAALRRLPRRNLDQAFYGWAQSQVEFAGARFSELCLLAALVFLLKRLMVSTLKRAIVSQAFVTQR